VRHLQPSALDLTSKSCRRWRSLFHWLFLGVLEWQTPGRTMPAPEAGTSPPFPSAGFTALSSSTRELSRLQPPTPLHPLLACLLETPFSCPTRHCASCTGRGTFDSRALFIADLSSSQPCQGEGCGTRGGVEDAWGFPGFQLSGEGS
jgi:hypothetical protein